MGRSMFAAMKLFRTKGENLLCKQKLSQVKLTLCSPVLADMRGPF